MVERLFFCGGEVGGDAFEGAPEYLVAAAAFVDREVALEHAALGGEDVDVGQQVRATGMGQFGGCRWAWLFVDECQCAVLQS